MDVHQGWAHVVAPSRIALGVSLGHYEGAVLAVAYADDFYKLN
jgi:hypothetical protein